MKRAAENPLGCPDASAQEKMLVEIDQAMKAGDTVGGVFEVAALGVPPGLGGFASWEQRLGSRLGAALLHDKPEIRESEAGPAPKHSAKTDGHLAEEFERGNQ